MSWVSRLFGRAPKPPLAALSASTSSAPQLPALAAPPLTGPNALDNATPEGLPRIRREPAIQIAPSFQTVDDCKSVITLLDFGQFQLASWLLEQMLWNPRFRGVVDTRLDALVGTPLRWEPGRQNELARRAARDIVEDWPLIVTAQTRKQLHKWGLHLGVGFAQKHWYESPTSGRAIPRLEVYHPQWAIWDWASRSYRIFTMDGWAVVPSPSLLVPGQEWKPFSGGDYEADTLRRWVVHEPFGMHSWREGLIHAVWDPWLRNTWGNRDLARGSEKLGIGIVKVEYPKATDKKALNMLIGGIRSIGSEGVLPVEVYPDQNPDGLKSYNVSPFEWSGNGIDWVRSSREAAAAELAILELGHNTTAETKGASVGASAQVGNLIRGDKRVSDCASEQATMQLQVLRDWAEVNYGDAGVAPIMVPVTDPPEQNQAAAQTLLNLAVAVTNFDKVVEGVDYAELLNRFRVPQKSGGVTPKPQPTTPPGAPGATGAQAPNQNSNDDEDR